MSKRYSVVGINCDYYSTIGPCAVAHKDTITGRKLYLLRPIFKDKYAAEVFADVCEDLAPDAEDNSGEMDVSARVIAFIDAWNLAHGDDNVYPTPDGLYPKPGLMAEWFLTEVAA